MSELSKESVIQLLESLQPQHDKREAVTNALLAARYGSGIRSEFSVYEFISRIERYQEIALLTAANALGAEKSEWESINQEWAEIARFRVNQAIDYGTIITRIRAEIG